MDDLQQVTDNKDIIRINNIDFFISCQSLKSMKFLNLMLIINYLLVSKIITFFSIVIFIFKLIVSGITHQDRCKRDSCRLNKISAIHQVMVFIFQFTRAFD